MDVYICGTSNIGRSDGVDAATLSLQTVDYEHHEVHSGSHFQICNYALNQAADATIEFIIEVPDTTKWPHWVFAFTGSQGATLQIYENPTGIVGGTEITPLNNNFNSDNTSTLTITKDPTSIDGDGTLLPIAFLAGGTRQSGFDTRSRENILKQGTTYLFRITSLAVSNDISWCAQWYEHTNKA